jgi:hypothetical protein
MLNESASMSEPAELKVFISGRESKCDECESELGRSAWICLVESKGALCLACADLDHLEFLPTGNTALTRRSRKLSTLSAVVLKWSHARKRYERQGLLVEARALEAAEASCLADTEVRAARNLRRAERESELDHKYVAEFAKAIRQQYPSCPSGRESEIAEHACRKYSGRIGRTGDAKTLQPSAIELAVRAHVRHRETEYDLLLAQGCERHEARSRVSATVAEVLDQWQKAT